MGGSKCGKKTQEEVSGGGDPKEVLISQRWGSVESPGWSNLRMLRCPSRWVWAWTGKLVSGVMLRLWKVVCVNTGMMISFHFRISTAQPSVAYRGSKLKAPARICPNFSWIRIFNTKMLFNVRADREHGGWDLLPVQAKNVHDSRNCSYANIYQCQLGEKSIYRETANDHLLHWSDHWTPKAPHKCSMVLCLNIWNWDDQYSVPWHTEFSMVLYQTSMAQVMHPCIDLTFALQISEWTLLLEQSAIRDVLRHYGIW
jgi:hypothetical protein